MPHRYSIAEARNHLARLVHEADAASNDLVLVTRNLSDFANFDGLRTEDWFTL